MMEYDDIIQQAVNRIRTILKNFTVSDQAYLLGEIAAELEAEARARIMEEYGSQTTNEEEYE